MPTNRHNEADTRAKLIDPALHAARWVERVADAERATHGEIQREQSAIRIEIVEGKPFKRGRGRVDYLLRAFVGGHEQPLTLAFVEAKKEGLPPTQGLEQVKAYARRFAVKFVYSTNGHQFIEYDSHTGLTSEPRPIALFPSPAQLRERWFAATGLNTQSPALAPLLTAYHASGDRPRYYQDAAIRAVLERAALASAGKERPRALLSLATGAGKTTIAVGLLQRLSDSGHLRAPSSWSTATSSASRRTRGFTTSSARTPRSCASRRTAATKPATRASTSLPTSRSASTRRAMLPSCAVTTRKITSATSSSTSATARPGAPSRKC